jgi:hypothetical protein
MLSPETTTGAFAVGPKSLPVSMNLCAKADCIREVVAARGVLTTVTTSMVAANKRKVVVATELSFLSLLRLYIISPSVPRAMIMNKRIP